MDRDLKFTLVLTLLSVALAALALGLSLAGCDPGTLFKAPELAPVVATMDGGPPAVTASAAVKPVLPAEPPILEPNAPCPRGHKFAPNVVKGDDGQPRVQLAEDKKVVGKCVCTHIRVSTHAKPEESFCLYRDTPFDADDEVPGSLAELIHAACAASPDQGPIVAGPCHVSTRYGWAASAIGTFFVEPCAPAAAVDALRNVCW